MTQDRPAAVPAGRGRASDAGNAAEKVMRFLEAAAAPRETAGTISARLH